MFRVYQKWNYELHEYLPFLVLVNYNLSVCSDEDEEIINCAQCFKEVKVKDSYVSKEVHDLMGFGYGVCEKCCQEETERRRKYKDEEII